MAVFDFSQGALINNIHVYLQQHGITDVKVIDGYCHALAWLWSYKTLVGEQKECYELYKKIEEWNQFDDLETKFEKLFSQITWLQANIAADSLLHGNSIERINSLEQNSPIQEEFHTTFTFTEKEIIDLLKDVLKNEGKEVLISSHNHRVSVVFKDGVYQFFDSNRGVREFKTVEDFVKDPENGLIAGFTYENNRLAKILDVLNFKKIIPKSLSLNLQVIDLQGKTLGKYPQNPIEDIIQARIHAHQDPGVNNRSWENTVAAGMAASHNDVNSLKTLVKHHANINLVDDQGKTPLYKAAAYRSIEAMKFLIESGADLSINYKSDANFLNILQVAAGSRCDIDSLMYLIAASIKDNQVEMLRSTLPTLIKSGQINLNYSDPSGQTLLQIAIKSGNTQIVSDLLVMGASINDADLGIAIQAKNKETEELIAGEFLHTSIKTNNINLVKDLLRDFPNTRNHISVVTSESPLIAALKAQQDALASSLLTEENIKSLSAEGNPPFIVALQNGCLETMKHLMQDPYPTMDEKENNLLHYAVKAGQPEVLEFLLQNGFAKYLNTPNQEGMTPIETALTGNNWQIVEMLLSHKDFKEPTNKLKTTLLHWAAQGSTEIFEKMLTKYQVPNQPDFIGRTPLCYAIESGNIENVKRLAALDDVCLGKQNPNTHFLNPLNVALEAGQTEIARFLITTYGKNLSNLPDKKGLTPLHATCESFKLNENEQTEFINSLLKQGATSVADKEGRMPLHHLASTSLYEDAANALLYEAPESIKHQDKEGMTPLHHAARINVEMVKFLLSKGASPTIKDAHGLTPIDIAGKDAKEYFNFLQFCQAVQNFQFKTVEKHPNLSTFLKMTDYNGNTALHLLIINSAVLRLSPQDKKQQEAMLQLLTKDPMLLDVNAKNKNGESPLQIALKYGDRKTVEFLLRNKNINIFTQNMYGENILHVLLKSPLSASDQVALANLFFSQAPALSYLKDKNKQTALHHAVLAGNVEVAKAIGVSVNINSPDVDGNTPLHLAVKAGDMSMIEYLISRGADVTRKNKAGQGPIDLAKSNPNPELPNHIEKWVQLHDQHMQDNKQFIESIVTKITASIPDSNNNNSIATELVDSLNKFNKHRPDQQFQERVIKFLEEKIKDYEKKPSGKNSLFMFGKNAVPDKRMQECSTCIREILKELAQTKHAFKVT